MHDLRAIREEYDVFDRNWARRGVEPQGQIILKMDEERRAVQTELQQLQQQRNEKSKEIGVIKAKKGDAQAIMDEVAALKDRMLNLVQKEADLALTLDDYLSRLPNLLADDVPEGRDEAANKQVRKSGEPPRKNDVADHADIGAKLGMMDFDTAVKMSGSRFVLMHSNLARLDRALGQFMLDLHTQEHGYTEVSPPLLVNSRSAYGTGQLPKFKDDLFVIENEEDIPAEKLKLALVDYRNGKFGFNFNLLDDETKEEISKGKIKAILNKDGEFKCLRVKSQRWLIPTAEVSLTNMVADMILDADALPLRFTAHTPCFRSEAGAAGKDTKGMIRQHQFYKVELVSITHPEKSNEEHERMTQCAETVLKKLGLAFRTMVLCAGDTGFGARKTYDIEVWLPGQNKYREISSCSNCGDFQARRMKARCRPRGEKDTQFVHTLNGSGVAVGRALIAVLENYWNAGDNSVTVPDVLRPYMGGLEKIEALADSKGPLLVASG